MSDERRDDEPQTPEQGDEELWSVTATSRVERDLARLPAKVAAAVVEFAGLVLPRSLRRMTKPLTGDLSGYRSARRGDYRLLVRLDEPARTVVLYRVDHRAHAYRPR